MSILNRVIGRQYPMGGGMSHQPMQFVAPPPVTPMAPSIPKDNRQINPGNPASVLQGSASPTAPGAAAGASSAGGGGGLLQSIQNFFGSGGCAGGGGGGAPLDIMKILAMLG